MTVCKSWLFDESYLKKFAFNIKVNFQTSKFAIRTFIMKKLAEPWLKKSLTDAQNGLRCSITFHKILLIFFVWLYKFLFTMTRVWRPHNADSAIERNVWIPLSIDATAYNKRLPANGVLSSSLGVQCFFYTFLVGWGLKRINLAISAKR